MFKYVLFITALTISLSVLTISANAKTLYVDVNGADTNTGSSNNPFRTIQKGVDMTTPGDTVYVRKGIYYELVNINNSGSTDSPITIEGELGSGGERLVTVDGGTSITGWVTAPEVGTGVYKKTSAPFEPGALAVEIGGVVTDVPRCRHGNCSSNIAKATDATVQTRYLGQTINWWDGIEAMFRHSGTTLYLRFADNSNPNSKTIRASVEGDAVFYIFNKTDVTIKNFIIRVAHRGIYVRGDSTDNIIIDNNEIYATGRSKIVLDYGPSDVEIKNNTMYGSAAWDLGSYSPGAWADGSTGTAPYAQAVQEWIYYCYKTVLSDTSSSGQEDDSILVLNADSGITIHDNIIHDSLIGISIYGADGETAVYNNTIYNMSSLGFFPSVGSNTAFYDNTVYNCNINVRFGTCENASNNRYAYVYSNKFYNPDGVGDHTFFHYAASSGSHSDFPKFWFYHNSFAGGRNVIMPSYYSAAHGGLKDTRFINNIFSAEKIYGNGGSTFYNTSSMIEICDYNWLGGAYSGLPAWAGDSNVDARNTNVWDNSSLPDFVLPVGHAARESGIDVSTNFTINGRTYPALPGMEPGYYVNEKPDMGFDLPNPPENFRTLLN